MYACLRVVFGVDMNKNKLLSMSNCFATDLIVRWWFCTRKNETFVGDSATHTALHTPLTLVRHGWTNISNELRAIH